MSLPSWSGNVNSGAFFSDSRRSRRRRDLPQFVKHNVRKESKHEYPQHGQNRSQDFTAINSRFAERPKQSQHEKNSAGSKQQEIRPRKITGDWELRKECVAEKTSEREKESDPDRPIPASFHVDLAAPIRRIHR